LRRARKQLARAGIDSTPATSPRQLALQVLARQGSQGQALHDWLMALELLRYGTASASHLRQLKQLRQQLSRLA
jgi:hypothetical protein